MAKVWIAFAYGGIGVYIGGGRETHSPARLPRGVNPDPELGIFLEHFLIPLRLIGSGHSIPSPKPRVSDGAIF